MSTDLERVREFVVLADQIIDNPISRSGLSTTMSWTRTDESGAGTWTLEGPNEYLFRVLLLDVRNVYSGDLELGAVIASLRALVPDPELHEALDACAARLASNREGGTLVEDGKVVTPTSVFRLISYSEYHHRDLDKIRRLRELHPLSRMTRRIEFVNFVGGLVSETAWLRHAVGVAQLRGLLPDLDTPARVRNRLDADAQAAPASPGSVLTRGLMLLLAERGGAVEFTGDEVEQALADYGPPETVRVTVVAESDWATSRRGRLELRRPNAT